MNNEYGNCRFCGAPNTIGRDSGKIYCSEKCWLQNPQQQAYNRPQRQYPQPQRQPQRQEPNWNAIRQEKAEDIRENVLIKEACEFVRVMYQKGDINVNQIISSVKKMITQLRNIDDEEDIPENID